jgi:hypothetical protein
VTQHIPAEGGADPGWGAKPTEWGKTLGNLKAEKLMTLDRALDLYSIDATSWWDGMGDSDQMLGEREWIEARFDQLTDQQLVRLRFADNQVIQKAEQFKVAGSWDVSMLLQTAAIAERHHAAV